MGSTSGASRALTDSENTFTNAPQQITIDQATDKGLIVKGAAAQSANLQEWQNSVGSTLVSIDSSGNITLAGADVRTRSLGVGAAPPGSVGRVLIDSPGPHAIGGGASTRYALYQRGVFDPAGSSIESAAYLLGTFWTAVAGTDAFGMLIEPRITEAASGTHTQLAGVRLNPEFVAGAATTTRATGLTVDTLVAPAGTTAAAAIYITNAPTGATDNYALWVDAGTSRFDGGLDLSAANIATDTTTGTKIGTAATQKIGFYNATPIVQPAANPDTSGATLAALETEVNQVKQTLRDLGLMAV